MQVESRVIQVTISLGYDTSAIHDASAVPRVRFLHQAQAAGRTWNRDETQGLGSMASSAAPTAMPRMKLGSGTATICPGEITSD